MQPIGATPRSGLNYNDLGSFNIVGPMTNVSVYLHYFLSTFCWEMHHQMYTFLDPIEGQWPN